MESMLTPWGMRLATDRLPHTPPVYSDVTLDGATQLARYTDVSGAIIELGRHGTNQTRGTATMSGGGDGPSPQRQTQDDNTTDYDDD